MFKVTLMGFRDGNVILTALAIGQLSLTNATKYDNLRLYSGASWRMLISIPGVVIGGFWSIMLLFLVYCFYKVQGGGGVVWKKSQGAVVGQVIIFTQGNQRLDFELKIFGSNLSFTVWMHEDVPVVTISYQAHFGLD